MSASTREIFGDGGVLARALGGEFESRPEQERMAEAVVRAMESRTHLLVEAGTGVGKSFAYLVPAILRATRSGETVVVATNTISLQEQLVQKDIPLLTRALGLDAPEAGEGVVRPLKSVLVKGRGNYISIRRLKLASQRQDRLLADPAARRSLHVIEEWAYATRDGTLSTLPALERAGVWDKVQSDSGNCMGRKCPHFAECFYQSARKELDGANLLVCNHALFFSDLALRAQDVGFLPEYQHVVLDEAHNVEDVASEHFGVSLSEGRVAHLLSTLYQGRSGKGYLPQLALLAGDIGPVEAAIRLVDQAAGAMRGFFDDLLRLCERGEDWARRDLAGRRLREPGAVANVLTPAMRELSLRLKALKDLAKVDADKYELNSYAQRAEMIAADAEVLVSQSLPGFVYWVDVGGLDEGRPLDGRGPRATIACAPIEVSPLLKERLFAGKASVVLTSATLATRRPEEHENAESGETAFAHAMNRLGCIGATALQLGSPFNYARQVDFVIDRGVDSPQRGPARGGYAAQLAQRVLHHVRETGGGAFVLFTSFATLNAVARELAGTLSELGLPMLAQGRDGPRGLILERFRENERSVLLGAASFWQGVDVRGRGLRNVIITKLPFEPPDRPLTEARAEAITARGGDPFSEDALPRAVIRFKQGFGRLIRSASDHGRVVVLDPRIVTSRYGRAFLRALPEGVQPRFEGEVESA